MPCTLQRGRERLLLLAPNAPSHGPATPHLRQPLNPAKNHHVSEANRHQTAWAGCPSGAPPPPSPEACNNQDTASPQVTEEEHMTRFDSCLPCDSCISCTPALVWSAGRIKVTSTCWPRQLHAKTPPDSVMQTRRGSCSRASFRFQTGLAEPPREVSRNPSMKHTGNRQRGRKGWESSHVCY